MRKLSSLVVVAPFYNEEAGARVFYDTVSQYLDKLDLAYYFVFVDDGSSDNTLRILNSIADEDPRVTVLGLSRNFGHQIALTAGLDYADGEAVVVMDSDLQHPPATILEMVQQYEMGYDVVYAARKNDDNRGFGKRIVAQFYYSFLQKATRLVFIRGAVDFRLISQKVLKSLVSMRETHRYLRGMVPWLGFDYAVVYYEQQQRYAGASTYSWRKLYQLARYGLFSFSTIPLDIITWLGFLVTILGGLYFIFVLIVMVTEGPTIPGWTSVIAVLLIVSGVQLISIGVLAQYIGMIFEQVKGRPLYVLKQERKQTARPASQTENAETVNDVIGKEN